MELAEIHKFDTAKVIKDDKLLKYCKTQFLKMLKPLVKKNMKNTNEKKGEN